MARFKPYNYDQHAMIVINCLEQLQPSTFEHAVHCLIEHKLDLSVFHPKYRSDDTGRFAYDPAILLKIILFAYSKGITSSREMQWCCETNILFKALSCPAIPRRISPPWLGLSAATPTRSKLCSSRSCWSVMDRDCWTTSSSPSTAARCRPVDAAKEWSCTFKELGEKRDKLRRLIRHHLREHFQHNKAETEAELERDIRHAKMILSLDKSMNKVDQFLKTQRPRMGQGKRSQEVKSNLTDNESAKMTTGKGTIQGYNGVAAVDKKHQIIIDAQAFGEGQEHHTLQPGWNASRSATDG